MIITQDNIRDLLKAITEDFEKNKEELCGYDRAIGDGDHGDSMARGTRDGYAAVAALPEESSVFECIKVYSRTMLATIGGAIGPIFSTVIMELGRAAKATNQIGAAEYAAGLKKAAEKVMDLGGAQVGDKTLVDALVPAAEAAEANSGKSLEELAVLVEKAAGEGVASTIPMQAKMGRSHFLREKSVGHQDAGATSLHYMLRTISTFVNN
ncbi:MAG: dihydroxyacetone kinase subunit DhaL [Lachnospiraceae bacterium]|nr:dihydroxyacetone kinase subunit DhaL [Lachnospiraceae bacterium]